MFAPLTAEVINRFAAVEACLKASKGQSMDVEQTAKGLCFVQVYAAYEFTVRAVVRTAVDAITAHNHRTQDLIPSLMALFLDAELSGLKDCPAARTWEYRIKLFETLFSNRKAAVHNTVFPNDGSHFRDQQLQTIFNVLGIKRTPAQRKRHLFRINEVVGHRNNIAHGQDTAESVGQRYSRPEVLHIIRQIKSVCILLVSAVSLQCSQKRRHRRKKRN